MYGASNRIGLGGALTLSALLAVGLMPRGNARPSGPSSMALREESVITNLAQLARALSAEERACRSVRIEGVVCAASRPGMGVLVVRDTSGVELLELGRRTEEFRPGERIRIEGTRLLLRRRDLGTQISAAPVMDNDGLHPLRLLAGEVALKAGRVPLEVDWFNCRRNFGLEVSCQPPNGQPQKIPASALWHTRSEPAPVGADVAAARQDPGLLVECYEGCWAEVPDFDLLQPVKTGVATNFELGFRSRDELVGLRFRGFFDAPSDGTYSFRVGSDDGALLFVEALEAAVSRLGASPAPAAAEGCIGESMNDLQERRWLALEGRVSFISRTGEGLELELRSGVDALWVRVADAAGLEPAGWLNSRVRAAGVGRGALSASQKIVLDRLAVASGRDLQRVDVGAGMPAAPLPITAVSRVQTLPLADANRRLPVRVCGVVTASNPGDRWCSLQDDTRGIFVGYPFMTNHFPVSGDLWEVAGHTAPGDFAPVIVAEQMRRLGQGLMPEPARPAWSELANGSMDVQWVEFHGVISGVQSNRLTLVMPEGPLEVQMENYFEADLRAYRHAVVRIRGTLFAIWNADTREVRFGNLLMRGARVSVEVKPPDDPFSAPAKSARDLLLFNAQAAAFHPVKVRARVLYTEAQEVFAMDADCGLRVLAADTPILQPGDWFEAVGYPEIGGPSPRLQYALVRKTGTASLPRARVLGRDDLTREGLDTTLVCVEGKLTGVHWEQHSPRLEMQSAGQLFFARVKSAPPQWSLRPGSQLQLTGVYAQTGHARRLPGQATGFELLLNSAADIRVLSQPSWWTLGRLAAVVGLLLVILLLAVAWITQLRHQVEQRTAQLQRETRQRERAERQRAIEAERSRIARDLHDDLGSSLTEIGVLASTGQRQALDGDHATLFRNIAVRACGLIASLDVIVWAVDPDDNSLQSLADYLSGFAGDFLLHSGLACRFKVPVTFPPVSLDGQVRHGLLLAVKESLNNLVRHAAATQVEFGMGLVEGVLEIVIRDNGKGFDVSAGADGHGLKNLPARLAKLGGSSQVHSLPGQGTTVTIRLPLSTPVAADANSAAG
jgi:signal transduction histidine kinase